ncbi:MAG: hypothetical protein LBB40_02840 [Holophagales bacterium]|jgi:hypothetical protein|nr:hypothetical protein [Holophagales bacterium]
MESGCGGQELSITLKEIKRGGLCDRPGWKKLLNQMGMTESSPNSLPLQTILKTKGIAEALRALRVLNKKYENAVRLFVCHCARQALPTFEGQYPGDARPRKAIEAAEKYARGEIQAEVMNAACEAAEDAAHGVAHEIAHVGAAEAFRYKYSTHSSAQKLNAAYVAAYVAKRAACAVACVAVLTAGVTAFTTYAYTVAYNTVDAISWVNADVTDRSLWDSLIPEFQRLCRLEGDYCKVVRESDFHEPATDEESLSKLAETGRQVMEKWSYA